MKTVDHKCPNCNANIVYSPGLKKWKCDYCGGVFSKDELKENEENFKKTKTEKKKNNETLEMDEYFCEDCGAKIIADKNTAATFCVYCKNTAILKSRLTDEFAPSKIIPFSKTKDDAIKAFKEVCKGKILMPKEFNNPKNIEELKGIYIPFWLYSCVIDEKVEGSGNRITTYSDSKYIYTKTDIYDIQREYLYTFNEIPCDGSERFDNAIMNSIEPFDYKELTDFNSSYLAGFLAEKYDVNSDDAKKITKERASTSSYSHINSTIAFSSFIPRLKESNVTEESIEYVLLPVWMVNIKYNGKMYTFAMNGETGKMIGDIPYSVKKAVIMWIIVFIISFLIVALITYMV